MSGLDSLPALGVGMGFREPYLSDLFLKRGSQESADFLEVTADHYMDAPPEKLRELELLRHHFPLIPHGLDLSLGSAEGLDPAYLGKFARVVKLLEPAWWSEHIAFTRAGGVEIGHLTPLPFTREALDALCRNIREAKRAIPVPLILENISYPFALPGAEMTEAEFLTEALERTDCGLLLDVTNVYTNATNHGFDPRAFVDALPLNRVVQLHFVGGNWQGGELIDSHSQPTPPEVWELLEYVVARAPVKGIILERDENLPPFQELADEITRAREVGMRHGRW